MPQPFASNLRFRPVASCLSVATLLTLPATTPLSANELYINEIFFNPAGDDDSIHEYIEIRGTPGMSLDNHYLLFLENEGQDGGNGTISGNAGNLDAWFDFAGQSIGSNGFLVLRQGDFFPPAIVNPYDVAPGTTDLKQAVPFTGFGTINDPSTIGWNSATFQIENGGFSALLISSGDTPANLSVAQDFDEGNDGLDALPDGWTIIDGIGVHAEADETEFGRLYAPMNFGIGGPTRIESGANYVGATFSEIEYVARLGDSTGQTENDWWAGNLTNNLRAPGFEGLPDNAPNLRLSAGDGPGGDQTGPVEATTDQLAYATIVTNHLGATNLGEPVMSGGLLGDYDDSGQVEQGDLNLVLNNWGGLRTFDDLTNTAFTDDLVNQEELNRVLNNWGSGNAPNLGTLAVPEPAALGLVAVSLAAFGFRRR
ncbi:MAG: PEP-CTERM sorting domain-containing protein [Planctomycetota bacterium]